MTKESNKAVTWAKYLGYAGLIPFLLCCIGIWTFDNPLAIQQLSGIFIFYSAVILSVMAGTLWGAQIVNIGGERAVMALLLAISTSLSAWFSLLLPPLVATVVLFLGYVLLLNYERWLPVGDTLPDWYHTLRTRLTTIVVGLHFAFGLGISMLGQA